MAEKKAKILTDEQLMEAATAATGQEEEQNIGRSLPMRNYEQVPDYVEELLLSWVAPERTFRPRISKTYVRNLALVLILIVLLLIFTNQFALLIVVLSLIFLAYVLVNVPPQKVRHDITNYGVYTHNKFYSWLDRGKRFWFEENYGQRQVVVETKLFPYRLVMLVGHERNEPLIKKALGHYLIEQQPERTKADNLLDWVKKTFPLE